MRRAPGIPAVVLTPAGAVAGPKVAQTRMFGAKVLEVRGDFDEALAAAQELGRRGTHVLVNSVNPYRRAGQKTAVFEIVEELGAAPDAFVIPYGGGGNTSAYAAGIGELGLSTPIFSVEAEHRPTTLASAIRIGDPVHAESVRASGATVVTVSDEEIVAAWLQLATVEGLFCEPSSAAGLAAIRRGAVAGERLVVTITGHGLKDTESADRYAPPLRAGRGRPRRDRRRSTGMTVFRAPATSANIGAGFDTAAVAFDLWNELEVTDGSGVTVEGEGAAELPADESNLAVRAYALLADPAGKHFRFTNRIPLERGLGSSAAAIALGLVAAAPNASAEELLAVGITLEPHADNLAAALLGGLTLSWDGRIARIAERLPLAAVAVVPRERTSTESSRKTLPATVPHDEAAASAGRAALLGAGAASGDASLFSAALSDWLHEPYRPSPDARRDPDDATGRLRRGDAVGIGADRDRLGLGRGCLCRRPPRPLPRPRDPRARHRTAGRPVSVVLVDVRPRTDYEAGHVPGAVHLDPETDLSAIGPDPADGGRHPLPDVAQLERVFGRAGIGPSRLRARARRRLGLGRALLVAPAARRPRRSRRDRHPRLRRPAVDGDRRAGPDHVPGATARATTRSPPRRSSRGSAIRPCCSSTRGAASAGSARRSRSTRSPAGSPAPPMPPSPSRSLPGQRTPRSSSPTAARA